MISETQYGAFRGGKLIQQKGQIRGAIKNEPQYVNTVAHLLCGFYA